MRKPWMAARPQSGAVSYLVLGLTGLAAFVAGAAAIGLLAPERNAAAPLSVTTVTNPARAETPAAAFARWRDSMGGEAVLTWPYESGGRAAGAAPGRNRPDRLGGPEGWTPEPPVGP